MRLIVCRKDRSQFCGHKKPNQHSPRSVTIIALPNFNNMSNSYSTCNIIDNGIPVSPHHIRSEERGQETANSPASNGVVPRRSLDHNDPQVRTGTYDEDAMQLLRDIVAHNIALVTSNDSRSLWSSSSRPEEEEAASTTMVPPLLPPSTPSLFLLPEGFR